MKIVVPLFLGFTMMVSGVSMSQTESAPYVSQLNSLTEKCDLVAINAVSDEINTRAARMMPGTHTVTDDPIIREAIAAGTEKINACLSDAKKDGVDVFKQYSKNESTTIKQDMKGVLVAWLPYVSASATQTRSTARGESGNNSFAIAKAAYDKAVSTLQVDRLTN